ncbi:MAG: exopolysaccharide biosynthesis polyprenyl glycosylphosphotransferase, partial [Flavobacteriaceae bacterium]
MLGVKFLMYWVLKKYRLKGGNRRKTVIIGHNESTKILETFFLNKPIYGYNYLGFFTNRASEEKLGDFNDFFKYIKGQGIDDIYCSISEFTEADINRLITYANTHFKTLKFIPDSNQMLSSGFEVDYYDYFPVLKMQELALNKNSNRLLKRAFDIIFSLAVIIGILSWLTPLLYILLKLESNGSVFYIKDRNGLDYKKFKCYKFRTLHPGNTNANHVAVNDDRVTRIGKFLRKTSIDELPQFINVLKGDMSVVGPRPHMLAYNKAYSKQVDNVQLMARHRILPGVTGLAQVRGFRGAVENNSDIIGRVKLDLFYIKNWSILLDVKIIFMTLFSLFKGDDKAF